MRRLSVWLTVFLVASVAGSSLIAKEPAKKPAPVKGQPVKAPVVERDAKLHLSKPYTQDNLTVFLITGSESMPQRKLLTLAEALEKKLVVVHETNNVNQLEVENKGEFDVFIMSGDIVKGGRQDRVLGTDFVLAPKSGRLPIAAFCVEHGRWQRRGTEDATAFGSTANIAVGNSLKGAISSGKSQGEVWKEVAANQSKLSSNVGKSVNSPLSASSLQLSLEDKNVQAKAAAYETKLATAVKDENEAIGVVVVVNGQISSADVFGSKELFQKVWPRILKSASLEALAEQKKDAKPELISADTVEKFLTSSLEAEKKEDKFVQAEPARGRAIVLGNNANNNANNNPRIIARPPAPAVKSSPKSGLDEEPAEPGKVALDLPVRLFRYEKKESLVLECLDKAAPEQIIHRSYLSKPPVAETKSK